MTLRRRIMLPLLLGAALLAPVTQAQIEDDDYRLPSLGDASSSVFSTDQEYELGRIWLKAFRSRVELRDDPLLQMYLEDLIYRLAQHSELKDRRLDLVVVDNKVINAFAVPGGVIGVHDGIFLYANNESQLAGILGHELAHISQRHFARSIERQRAASIPTMAALLAGIVLAATSGSDAGLAAITAGQAAALQSQLRFSRENEQEADRIGMQTLARADMDPGAMPEMFEIMNAKLRYQSRRPPEFLLTHPLTESRISDTAARARAYPRKVYPQSLEYQLMRKRVEVAHASNRDSLLASYRKASGSGGEANRYGIAVAEAATGEFDKALRTLQPLLDNDPNRISYVYTAADILLQQRRGKDAADLLLRNLRLAPDNYALKRKLAQVWQATGNPHRAEEVLTALSKLRPEDPEVWYHLAEVRGLAGNILGLHLARAEYFILVGNFDAAEKQLSYAFPLAQRDPIQQTRIKQRARDIQNIRDKIKQF